MQASAGLLWTEFARQDPGNPLLRPASGGCWSGNRTTRATALRVGATDRVPVELPPPMTPFALPPLAERPQERLASEARAARVERRRRPCFLAGPRGAVLPAFGSFTGGCDVRPGAVETACAVAGSSVVPAAGRRTAL